MRTPAAALVGCAVLLAVSVGCARSETAAPADTTTTPADIAANALGPNPADPDQVQGVHEAQVPDDRPDPTAFSFGQETVITGTQVEPAQLVSKVNKELAVRNATAAPVTVEFLNGPLDEAGGISSTEIGPGESFRFTPTLMRSITFRVAGQPTVKGAVLVDIADFEP
jgi:hypothetical protein